MAPRRGRAIKVTNNLNYNNLTVNEVLCPICRSILIEPVSLPCNHVFCSSCLQGTIENTNLVCPLCRVRIGSWLRCSKKENKLINVDYWNAIKKLFPTQIKNKLDGIEEDLEENIPLIRLSHPGEIRAEYEIQRKKEDEVARKERESEAKASKKLIEKIRSEEEYRKMVEAEKLKLDEEFAKKLAQELLKSNSHSCSSKPKRNKSGPLDKYLKSEAVVSLNNATNKDNNTNINPTVKIMDFVNKEYSCHILCQDVKHDKQVATNKSISFVQKKMQQIQKICDSENNSDSSDCIESEYRYFKPVDYRHNPPSKGVPPVKVPPKMAQQQEKYKISAPNGTMSFRSHCPDSAFARLSYSSQTPISMVIKESTSGKEKIERVEKSDSGLVPTLRKKKISSPNKRKCAEDQLAAKRIRTSPPINDSIKSNKPNWKNGNSTAHVSPAFFGFDNNSKLRNKTDARKCARNVEVNNLNLRNRNTTETSPPFMGFNNNSKLRNRTIGRKCAMDIKMVMSGKSNQDKIKLQEQADFEFAKKLQNELDNSGFSSRSQMPTRTRHGTRQRQTTLDATLSTYKVK